jgi:hypothetical protein
MMLELRHRNLASGPNPEEVIKLGNDQHRFGHKRKYR